jgi:hypothetical protein
MIITSVSCITEKSFGEKSAEAANAFRFAIYLTDKSLFSIFPKGGPYSYSNIADLDKFTLQSEPLITDKDIKFYDWKKQILVLTEEVSKKMIQKYGKRPIMEIMKIFVVTVDGKRLYAGAMTYPQSAMFLNFPIIFPKNANGVFIICIRPSTFFATGPYPDKSEYMQRYAKEISLIENPEIKRVLSEIVKLVEERDDK